MPKLIYQADRMIISEKSEHRKNKKEQNTFLSLKNFQGYYIWNGQAQIDELTMKKKIMFLEKQTHKTKPWICRENAGVHPRPQGKKDI